MSGESCPALRGKRFLHLMPSGALVQIETGLEDRVWRYMIDEVDDKTSRVLALCDGTRSEETIAQLCPDMSPDEVASILEVAEWRGIVTRVDDGIERPVAVQGSREWYVPIHMYLEITDHCNLACRHCYRDAGPERRACMDLGDLYGVLETLTRAGLRAVEITGGEPLTHPRFMEIMQLAADRCEVVALLTNGFLVDDTVVERVTGCFGGTSNLMVSVSVNSSTPAFHDAFVCRSGSWERATRAIKLFAEAGTPVRFTMNIVPENLRDLQPAYCLARELGARAFAASPVLPFGRGSHVAWSSVSHEEAARFEATYARLRKEDPQFVMGIPELVRRRVSAQHCGAGFRTFAVAPDGCVRPCVNVSEKLLSLGNVFEQSPEDVFSSSIAHSLRGVRAPGPETCHGCELESFCQLCWYRGLVGSRIASACRWIETAGLEDVPEPEELALVAESCRSNHHPALIS